MGINENSTVTDLQTQYENETSSYEQLLQAKSDRDDAIKSRDNYYMISIGTVLIGAGLLAWDLFSKDKPSEETADLYNQERKFSFYTQNNRNNNILYFGIRKKF